MTARASAAVTGAFDQRTFALIEYAVTRGMGE